VVGLRSVTVQRRERSRGEERRRGKEGEVAAPSPSRVLKKNWGFFFARTPFFRSSG
jgi:hypothetical protein